MKINEIKNEIKSLSKEEIKKEAKDLTRNVFINNKILYEKKQINEPIYIN